MTAMSEPIETRRSRAPLRFALAALAATAALGAPGVASAETVSPTGKGITGCALLGGEVVVFAEGIFGVRSPAAYLIGAGAGAVAGGVGGYFLEQGVDDGRVPAYLLAGGLALIIPAIVVALDQTRYLPSEGAREDKPVTNLPPAEPGKPGAGSVVGAEPGAPAATPPAGGTTPAPAPAPAPAPTQPGGAGGGGTTPAPQSLFDVHEGNFRLGMPLPAVRPVFSMTEQKKLGVSNPGSELRFPVVHVTF